MLAESSQGVICVSRRSTSHIGPSISQLVSSQIPRFPTLAPKLEFAVLRAQSKIMRWLLIATMAWLYVSTMTPKLGLAIH